MIHLHLDKQDIEKLLESPDCKIEFTSEVKNLLNKKINDLITRHIGDSLNSLIRKVVIELTRDESYIREKIKYIVKQEYEDEFSKTTSEIRKKIKELDKTMKDKLLQNLDEINVKGLLTERYKEILSANISSVNLFKED